MKFLIAIFLSLFAVIGQTQVSSTFGGVFSPKGDVKFLLVYASFKGSKGDQYLKEWPASSESPSHTAELDNFIFDSSSDFEDPDKQELENISNYYYEMSHGQLRVTGGLFTDASGNIPNIEIEATQGDSWSNINLKVLKRMYQVHPQFNFSPYDQWENRPNFHEPKNCPDGKPDYVIIVYRYDNKWKSDPSGDLHRQSGSGGGFSSLGLTETFSFGDYDIGSEGFTYCKFSHDFTLFLHEVAHELYNAPHIFGANGVSGNYLNVPYAGIGMMTSDAKFCKGASGWESWLLGWVDLKYDLENSTETIICELKDFYSSGDVMRIRLPHTNDFLWIENHQRHSKWDKGGWEGKKHGASDSDRIPKMEKGLLVYVESISPSHQAVPSIHSDANGIKLLSSDGNYDWYRSEKATDEYLWKNKLYGFSKGAWNPVSGTNEMQYFLGDLNNDGFLRFDKASNSGGKREQTPLMVVEEEFVGTAFSGAFFHPDDVIGINGKVYPLNHPQYNWRRAQLDPIILSGLEIEVLKQIQDGSIQLKVSFDKFTIKQKSRWAGRIDLKDEFILTNQLLIDKSGTVNTLKKQNGDFIRTTEIRLKKGSKLELEPNALLVLEGNSRLVVEEGAQLILEPHQLKCREGSAVIYEGQ